MTELIIKKKSEIGFGLAFERVEDDDPLNEKIFNKLYNTDYQKGYIDLIIAVQEIKQERFCFDNEYSQKPIEERIGYIDKIYERVLELYNYTRELDDKYALSDEYVLKALKPLFILQSEVEELRKNLYFQLDRYSETTTTKQKKDKLETCKKIIPLAEKIIWKADTELLETHLEKLKDKKFIQYVNTKRVMSGDEIAMFIKHKEYQSPSYNAAGLFRYWQETNCIDDYIEMIKNQETNKEEPKEKHNFIIDSFQQMDKVDVKPFNPDSLKSNAANAEREKKIEDAKKHFISILTA